MTKKYVLTEPYTLSAPTQTPPSKNLGIFSTRAPPTSDGSSSIEEAARL